MVRTLPENLSSYSTASVSTACLNCLATCLSSEDLAMYVDNNAVSVSVWIKHALVALGVAKDSDIIISVPEVEMFGTVAASEPAVAIYRCGKYCCGCANISCFKFGGQPKDRRPVVVVRGSTPHIAVGDLTVITYSVLGCARDK